MRTLWTTGSGGHGRTGKRDDFQVKSEKWTLAWVRWWFGGGSLWVRWSFADSLLTIKQKSEGRAKGRRPEGQDKNKIQIHFSPGNREEKEWCFVCCAKIVYCGRVTFPPDSIIILYWVMSLKAGYLFPTHIRHSSSQVVAIHWPHCHKCHCIHPIYTIKVRVI